MHHWLRIVRDSWGQYLVVCSEIEQGTGGNGDSVYIVHLLTLTTLYTSHSPLSKQLTVLATKNFHFSCLRYITFDWRLQNGHWFCSTKNILFWLPFMKCRYFELNQYFILQSLYFKCSTVYHVKMHSWLTIKYHTYKSL